VTIMRAVNSVPFIVVALELVRTILRRHEGCSFQLQASCHSASDKSRRSRPVSLADAVPAALFTATTLLPAGVKTPAWWPLDCCR
jgi:hypothetical protein